MSAVTLLGQNNSHLWLLFQKQTLDQRNLTFKNDPIRRNCEI